MIVEKVTMKKALSTILLVLLIMSTLTFTAGIG